MSRLAKQVVETEGLNIRLVQTACALLAEPKGVKLPTMREIALAAGVSLGAAYRHFKSHDELFVAVITALFQDLEDHLKKAAEKSTNPVDALKGIGRAYVSWGVSNPGGYQLLFETTDEPEVLANHERPGFHLFEDLAKTVFATGGQDEALRVIIVRFWVMLHGLVSLRTHKLLMDWPNTIDEDISFLVSTLALED